MDIEKLINRLYTKQQSYNSYTDSELTHVIEDAITALSTLQAENEKLRAELKSKEKYYEQMIDALSATDSADLAQMTACVYYKPGGLCRYGGDDPANVCVLGPCTHERTAEEVLADLALMGAERDAAVEELENYMVQDVVEGNEPCGICAKASATPCECCDPQWRGIKED